MSKNNYIALRLKGTLNKMTKAAQYIKTDSETVGKEIEKNINQGDGLILISSTNNPETQTTTIRIDCNNEKAIIEALETRAFKSTNPAHTLNFIEQVIAALSKSKSRIISNIYFSKTFN